MSRSSVHNKVGRQIEEKSQTIKAKSTVSLQKKLKNVQTAPAGAPTSTTTTKGKKLSSNGSRTTRSSAIRSQTSAGTVKTTRQSSARRPSSNKKKMDSPLPSVNGEIDTDDDILFINIPSENEKTENDEKHSRKQISPDDILKNAQETNPKRVYEIILHAGNIDRICRLETFTSCRVLDLSCNYIKKMENLEQLSDLRELKVYDNKIAQLENLDCLKELCNLQLQHNLIKNIGKGLMNLKKLKQLRLDYNNLIKMEPTELASCSMITYLNISHNRLDNLAAVNCLSNLEELHASDNRIRVVTDLKRCKKLQELNLSRNKIADISGLKDLPKLMVLDVSHNQLFNTKTVGKSKNLHELNISDNLLTEMVVLARTCPNLEILNVKNNNLHSLEDLVELESLSELVELFINGNPFCRSADQQKSVHDFIIKFIPNLEILDGAHVKRITSKSAPLMRPMSASTVVSSRQVETQIKSLQCEISAFEFDLSKRFASLRSTMNDLPEESRTDQQTPGGVAQSRPTSSRPVSRCSARSRLQLAKEFAEHQDL
ncbi:uncharacterized protein LOC141903059 isoform X2 [Tubulanus polymorphus]